MYFVIGISVALTIYICVMADHLWKERFFLTCLLIAAGQFLVGSILEILGLTDMTPGIGLVATSSSIVFLGYFRLLRFLFIRIYGTEPHITSVSSAIGSPPLDMYTSAYKDGKKKKYEKDRTVIGADFVFSFLHALAPAFTILWLIALVKN